MRYVEIEEAGRLQVSYDGPILDLMSLAILEAELAALAGRVAGGSLAEDDLLDFPDHPWSYPQGWYFRVPFLRHQPIVESPIRLDCKRISYASPLELELAFAVAYVIANPHVLGVLHGVGGNIVTSIGASGLRGITRRYSRPARGQPQVVVDVGPNVRAIATVLARNANGRKATLKVIAVQGDQRQEVHLDLDESA